jgi:hypothetical protein
MIFENGNCRKVLLQMSAFFLFAVPTYLPAMADSCGLGFYDRSRLYFADAAPKLSTSSNIPEDIKLFLSFEIPYSNYFSSGVKCNEPNAEQIKKFSEIGKKLGSPPIEMRALVLRLIELYPDELLVHRRYISYNNIGDVLDGFASSGENDFSNYLRIVGEFRESFLSILKPNRIKWTIGVMPSGDSINLQTNKESISDAERYIDGMNGSTLNFALFGAGAVKPSTLELSGSESSITLINDHIGNYCFLHSLGIDPKSAAIAIKDEMRKSGHGYLGLAVNELARRKNY